MRARRRWGDAARLLHRHRRRNRARRRNDRRRHLAWRREVDLLGDRERGRIRQASAYLHVDRGRAEPRIAAGRQSQAFGHREAGCAQQLREVQLPHAECEIDSRIGVEIAQRDRARPVRTGQRRVDIGDLDRALGPPPGAIESQVTSVASPSCGSSTALSASALQARSSRAHVHVETEHIGADLKIHTAVRYADHRAAGGLSRRTSSRRPTSSPRASTLHALPPGSADLRIDRPACGSTSVSPSPRRECPPRPRQWPAS